MSKYTCQCLITHIEKAGRFLKLWVQCDTDAAQNVESGLAHFQAFLETSRGPESSDQLIPGDICVARNVNGKFYRCSILSAVGSKVKINFIDYGNTVETLLSEIRIFQRDKKSLLPFLKSPPQAISHYLYGLEVLPNQMTQYDLEWLKKMTSSDFFCCTICKGPYNVSLISVAMDKNMQLSQMIVQKSLGQLVQEAEMCKAIAEMTSPNYFQSGEYNRRTSTPSQAPTATMMSYPPSRVDPRHKPTMPIYQPPAVYHHYQNLQRVMDPALVSPHLSAPQSARKPSNHLAIGCSYQAFVSHIEDGPLLFYLQIKAYSDDILSVLNIELNKAVKKNFSTALSLGSIVMAMQSSDQTLRRGMVMSVGLNSCKIFYVDFGNSEELPHSNIFILPNSLQLDLHPPLALNFALSGLQGTKPTAEMVRGFKDLVLNQVLTVRFVSEVPMRNCDLFIEGKDVLQILGTFNMPLQYLRQAPPRKREVEVAVSFAENPSQLFIQYLSESSTLDEIQTCLSNEWKRLSEVSAGSLTIGKPVLSLYPEDSQWYRALVLDVTVTIVTVLYVDYGNKERVLVSQLRELSGDLVSRWRCQAVECCLVGYESQPCTDPEVLAFLNEYTADRTFTLQLHSLMSGDRLLVDLLDSRRKSLVALLKEHQAKKPAPVPPLLEKTAVQASAMADKEKEIEVICDGKKVFKPRDSSEYVDSNRYGSEKGDTNRFSQSKDWDQKSHDKPAFSQRQKEDRFLKDRSNLDKDDRFGKEERFSIREKSSRDDRYNREERFSVNNKPNRGDWGSRDDKHDQDRFNRDDKSKSWSLRDDKLSKDDKFSRGTHNRDDDNKFRGGHNREEKFNRGGYGRDDEKPKDDKYARGGYGRDDKPKEDKFGRSFSREDDKPKEDKFRGSFSKDDDRFGRGNREDKFGRGDREDKFSRGDRDDKFSRGDREDKFSRGDREDKFSRGDREDKFSRGDREDKFSRGDREDKFSRGDREDKFSRGDRSNRDKFDRDDKFSRDKTSRDSSRRSDDSRGKSRDLNRDDDRRRKDGAKQSYQPPKDLFSQAESWDDDATPAVATEIPVNYNLQEYPSNNIKTKTEYAVTLSHFEDPQRFFVHLSGSEGTLEEMRKKIDCDTKACQRPIPNGAVTLARPVLARYDIDKALYRAVITRIISPTRVDVLFVDYGNSSEVDTTEVFLLPNEMGNTAPLAILCGLSCARPPPQGWADPDTIAGNFSETGTLVAESSRYVDGLMMYQVRFTLADGTDALNNLMQLGFVKKLDVTSAPVVDPKEVVMPVLEEELEGEEWVERLDLLVGQFLQVTVLQVISKDTIVVQLVAARLIVVCSSPEAAAPGITPGTKLIAQVNCVLHDRLRVTLYNLRGHILGDNDSVSISPVCPMPKVRSSFKVLVSHSENSTLYLQKESDIPKIESLLTELFEFYNETQPVSKDWPENTLVAVKSSDENWYRARIVQKNTKVQFIDYGNLEVVTSDQIRDLDPKFFDPEFALRAEFDLKWKCNFNEFSLLDFLKGTYMASLIMKDAKNWTVDLTDMEGNRLAVQLKAMGHAEEFIETPFAEINADVGSKLITNEEVPVMVTHFDSPSAFWVQMTQHLPTVEAVQETLQAKADSMPDIQGQVSGIFAAKYSSDNLWYRAFECDSTTQTVRFIDYGNSDVATERKELSHTMQKPRSGYAIPMTLCAKPLTENWSPEAMTIFESFIDADKVVAVITSVTYRIVVDLKSGDKLLSHLLIEGGHAVFDDHTPSLIKDYLQSCENRVLTVYVPLVNSLKEFYIHDDSRSSELDSVCAKLEEASNLPEVKEVNMDDLVVVMFPEDETWYRAKVVGLNPTSVFLVDYGNQFEAKDFKVLPEELVGIRPLAVKCALETDIDEQAALDKFIEITDTGNTTFSMRFISKGDPNVVMLCLGDTNVVDLLPKIEKKQVDMNGQMVYLSHSNGPADFYVQLVGDSRIDNLIDELAQAESFCDTTCVSEGALVVALFPDDESWYRAKVISAKNKTVFFYDYGNSTAVEVMKELPPDLKSIPPLAYHCSLQKPAGLEDWPESATQRLGEVCDNESLFCLTVITQGDPTVVVLSGETGDLSSLILEPGETIHTMNEQSPKLIDNQLAYISENESTQNFYVHIVEDYKIICELKPELAKSDDFEDIAPTMGALVSAFCKDQGEWLRAKIINLNPLEAFFIDYGFKGEVVLVKKLPDELTCIEPLALPCALNLPEGFETTEENERKFFDVSSTRDQFIIKLVSPGDRHIVDLFLNDSSVSAIVCGKEETENPDVPKPNKVVPNSVADSQSIVSDLVSERIDSSIAAREILNETIKSAVKDQEIETEIETKTEPINEPITDSNKVSSAVEAVENNPLSEQPVEELSETISDLKLEVSSKSKEETPNDTDASEFLSVSIIYSESPHSFYVQNEKQADLLDHVCEKLETASEFEPAEKPEVGQLVVARFPEDGVWYRGRVTLLDPLTVFFIDYGNVSVITELKKVPEELSGHPPLAIHCSLRPPTNGQWSFEATNCFVGSSGNSSSIFKMTVLDQGDPMIVDLTLKGSSITDELLLLCPPDVDTESMKIESIVEINPNIVEPACNGSEAQPVPSETVKPPLVKKNSFNAEDKIVPGCVQGTESL